MLLEHALLTMVADGRGPPGRRPYTLGIDILVVCTGNICRSPVAEVLLADRLARRGLAARVHSAGLLGPGNPAADYSRAVATAAGLDLSGHRSRRLAPELLAGADLVLGMAAEHAREAVVMAPEAFGRIFTLGELVRRGEAIGPRKPTETPADWLARAHMGRTPYDLIAAAASDDVADPIGRNRRAYDAMMRHLDDLTTRLVDLLAPRE